MDSPGSDTRWRWVFTPLRIGTTTLIKIAERIEKKLDEDPETDIPDPERAKGDQGYTPQPGDKEILDKMKSEFKSEIDKLTGEPKC